MTLGARLAALCTAGSTLVAIAILASGTGTGSSGRGEHAPGSVAAVTRHPGAVTAGQQARVRRYWTLARMEYAAPLRPVTAAASGSPARLQWLGQVVAEPAFGSADGRRSGHLSQPPMTTTAGQAWGGGGAVARTTGKVFFTMGGHDFVCSASTVAGRGFDIVVTAAHCVKDGTGAWAANWTFVPGYANGLDPYGSYTARRFFVASGWSSGADNDYDVAFVTVNPGAWHGRQVQVVTAVGGQGIGFGGQPVTETAFGYPSDPPYDGQRLYYCGGRTGPDPYRMTSDTGLRCALTAGTSGGPWLSGFDRATGTGIITSVSSFKYSTDSHILYGPELGPAAQALYEAAQHG